MQLALTQKGEAAATSNSPGNFPRYLPSNGPHDEITSMTLDVTRQITKLSASATIDLLQRGRERCAE
jgi:hypothetical protein